MNLKSNIYEGALDTIGSIYGITYIKEILGIIILVLTIINILVKMSILIYKKVKSNKIEEIPQVIDEAVEQFKELEEKDIEDK